MQIVVTDGYTLNPGDLDWKEVEKLGTLTVHDRTSADAIVERCRQADVILTNKVPIGKEIIAQLPQLKLISVLATGYNVIDVAAAKKHNIVVCNVPAYGTASVAQHTFALLLELTNGVGANAQSVAKGGWVQSIDWCYTKTPLMELAGKTMGLVGFGHIGQQTAKIAAAFGMNVLYNSRHKKETSLGTYVSLEELFSKCDVVSLHCPLTPDNEGMVNKEHLKLMKPGSFFINTARGPLVNEQDLADALNNGIIGGAAIDVLSTEPPKDDNPLLGAKNCIVTPHNAWMSTEARSRVMQVTAQNIAAFIKGVPQNRVG